MDVASQHFRRKDMYTGILTDHGNEFHYTNGYRHRIHGPAMSYSTGRLEWWHMGLRHRDDGPAIVTLVGRKEWWQNGGRHRVTGPAIIVPGVEDAYYLFDTRVNKDDTLLNIYRQRALNEITEEEFVFLLLKHS